MERLICGCAARRPRVCVLSMDPGVRRDDVLILVVYKVTLLGCRLSMG
jgi:hypothetical protein